MAFRHVFVTGGTGYLGRPLIRELLTRCHTVRALVRPGSEKKLADPARRNHDSCRFRVLGSAFCVLSSAVLGSASAITDPRQRLACENKNQTKNHATWHSEPRT